MQKTGAVSWIDMVVADPGRVSDFYAQVAGLTPVAMPEDDEHTSYSLQNSGGADVLGICDEAVFPDWVRGGLPYIDIDDFDLRVAKVEEAGGTVLKHMTMDYGWPGRRFCLVRDPSGASAMLCETRAEEAESADG